MAVILSPKLMKGTVTASKLMYGLLSALTNVQNFQAGVIDLYQLIELVEGLLSVFGGLKKGATCLLHGDVEPHTPVDMSPSHHSDEVAPTSILARSNNQTSLYVVGYQAGILDLHSLAS